MVATEKAQKGQAVRKFLKAFYNTPSLIQGNSEHLAQPKINSIYKLFTSSPLLYLPFRKGIFASNSIPFHFIRDFTRGIMRTKLQSPSLNSHENGVLAGCIFKNSKYVYKHPSHLIALRRSKTLGFKENILIYCHRTTIFRGCILKIHPFTYVKAAF